MAAVFRRAETLEARVCAMANVTPSDVRRLEWTGRALAAARADAAGTRIATRQSIAARRSH